MHWVILKYLSETPKESRIGSGCLMYKLHINLICQEVETSLSVWFIPVKRRATDSEVYCVKGADQAMNNHLQDIAKVGTGVGLVIKEIIDSVGFKYPGSSITGKTLKTLRLHATDMMIGLTHTPKHTKLQGHQQGQRKEEDLSVHPEQPEHLFIPRKAKKPKHEFINFSYDIGLDSPSRKLGLPSIGSLEGEQLSNTRAPIPHRKSQPEDFNSSRKAAATDAATRTGVCTFRRRSNCSR